MRSIIPLRVTDEGSLECLTQTASERPRIQEYITEETKDEGSLSSHSVETVSDMGKENSKLYQGERKYLQF